MKRTSLFSMLLPICLVLCGCERKLTALAKGEIAINVNPNEIIAHIESDEPGMIGQMTATAYTPGGSVIVTQDMIRTGDLWSGEVAVNAGKGPQIPGGPRSQSR